MSDYISREQVIDVLKETAIIQDNDLGHLVVDEINRIPVAYNVDKVVEAIENLKEMENRERHCARTKELDKCLDFDDCEQCILEKALSFVKECGISE